MDILLLIIAGLLLLAGLAGSFLPVLPGPPLSWVGLLIASFSTHVNFSAVFLIITANITLVLTVFDYVMPGLAVKKKGGSKAGERGALAGGIIGMFMGPFGIIIGPFIGALIGELKAMRAAVIIQNFASTFNRHYPVGKALFAILRKKNRETTQLFNSHRNVVSQFFLFHRTHVSICNFPAQTKNGY